MIKKCGIYQIRCRVNGHLYIGSSVKIYARWSQHRTTLRREKSPCLHLQRAWTKHGEAAFHFSIIEECDRAILLEREQFYVDSLKPELNILTKVKERIGDEQRAKMAVALRARAALITHCPKGHAYDEANTMMHQGKRVCRKCNAERVSAVYASETPEQREARRVKVNRNYRNESEEQRAYRREYTLAHKEEKRAYDASRRAETAARRREQRAAMTPEQREAKREQKRAYYAANKPKAA